MFSDNVKVNPYLVFSGNCKEAMKFYAEIVDGDVEFMTFKEAPMEFPKEALNLIMHSSLTFGKAVLMASDNLPDNPVGSSAGHAVMVNAGTLEDAQHMYNNLSEGGKVIMPFEDTFWGAKFGQLMDKFGVQWMISYERPKQ